MDWTAWRAYLAGEAGLANDTVDVLDRHRRHLERTGFEWSSFLATPEAARLEGQRWLTWKKSRGDVYSSLRLAQRVMNWVASYQATLDASWGALRWRLHRVPAGRMEPYSPAELAKLTSWTCRDPWRQLRVELLQWLCQETGLRRGEICALHIEDITPGPAPSLRVAHPRKGGPPRWIPLPATTWDPRGPLAAYLAARPRQPKGPLWVDASGRQLTRKGFLRDFHGIAEAVGFPVNFNRFRHTRLTLLNDHRVPLERIQYVAGHRDPKMTLHYIRGGLELVRSAFVACGVPGYATTPPTDAPTKKSMDVQDWMAYG